MATDSEVSSMRIWTIPNVVSFIRLLGVPVFLWLLLGPHYDAAAVVVVAVGGATDWVDGYLARKLNQVSKLGALMDPVADRLYIFATLIALTVRGIVPWWFLVALVSREVVLALAFAVLRHAGYGPPPVHYIGKTGTFIILFAFPTLLLARVTHGTFWYATGWALAWWGIVLYWIAGFFYLYQVAAAIRGARRAGPAAA